MNARQHKSDNTIVVVIVVEVILINTYYFWSGSSGASGFFHFFEPSIWLDHANFSEQNPIFSSNFRKSCKNAVFYLKLFLLCIKFY